MACGASVAYDLDLGADRIGVAGLGKIRQLCCGLDQISRSLLETVRIGPDGRKRPGVVTYLAPLGK